jgi:hypothetical protein
MLTYYIPELGEEPEDARELKQPYSWRAVPDDPEDFARDAADYCHSFRDGWEWHWPKTFVILKDGAEVDRFEVDRETVPEFRTRRLNK